MASHQLLQARLHTRLASTLADLGRFDQAIAHCRQSIALLEAQGSTTRTPAWQWESAFVHAIQGYLRNKFGEANSVLDDVQQVYTLLATGAQQPEPDEALVFATVAEAEARFGAGEQESTLARLFALAENLHLAGELWLRVRVLALLAFYLRVKNRLTLCEVYIRERMALCELLGDQRGVAYCLADLGYNALFCDHPDPTTAQRYFTEMAVISDRLRHPIVRSDLLLGLAQIAYFRRAWGEARRYLTESMAIMRTGDNWLDVRVGKLWMGEVALEEGEHSEAQRSFDAVLNAATERGDVPVILLGLEGLAKTALRQGQFAETLPLLYFIQAHPHAWEFARGRVKQLLAEIQTELPADQIAEAREQGAALTLEDAIAWGQRALEP